MNPLIHRCALPPICASLILLLCTFNLSCSSSPCAPVFRAFEKTRRTPLHSFITMEWPDGRETSADYIAIDGTTYYKPNGKWITANTAALELEKLRATANISCQLEGTEFIDGESADYYVTHGTWKDDVSLDVHARYWISKSAGLPLRFITTTDAGKLAHASTSTRFEYFNITAPIISK